MTTPKSFHDVTTPTENVAELIISELLKIAESAKQFSTLMFVLLH